MDTHNLNPITGMWLEQRLTFIVPCWWGKLPVVAVPPPQPSPSREYDGCQNRSREFRRVKSSPSTPPNQLTQAEAQQGLSFTALKQFFLY